jgi:hypothetical protein
LNSYRQELVTCMECSKEFALGQRLERQMQQRARTDFDPFTGR